MNLSPSGNMKFQSALITGATSGIGKELAHLLAKKNISLILTGRDEKILATLSKELSTHVTCIYMPADLAKKEDRQKLIELIENHPVDLLINGAGYGIYGEMTEIDAEEEMKIIEVNVDAVVELSIAMAKKWKKEKKEGVILNISSAIGFFSAPQMGLYAASKAFLIPFSKALDYELRPTGIRVLVSCPGQVATQFAMRAAKKSHPIDQSHAMSASLAAEEIYWQIEKRKRLYIFDWRFRFLVYLSHLFPDFIRKKVIAKSIKKRQ